ncbi:MAG: aldehyde dehydrogenase family protein [Pirellulales bacterium]
MSTAVGEALRRMSVPAEPSGVVVGGEWSRGRGTLESVVSPINGSLLGEFHAATPPDVDQATEAAATAFLQWRCVPAPQRGEFVRQFGERLRQYKEDLATVVSWEAGKITTEALGEVQEMIDICDFAVGLSRQLYGKTIASERPGHRLSEYWHPLGPVGVISAFNFPVAVWAWNAAIAWVCGDPVVWKPSDKTPLTALACQALVVQTLERCPDVPAAVSNVVVGGVDVGQSLAASARLPLVSATGSVAMGRAVARTVAARLGRSLLELGGNNGMIVTPSADIDLAVRSITFAAVGTCGQRCTTLRRLIVHESIADALRDRLLDVYCRLPIGDPTKDGTLVGPLINEAAGDAMQHALAAARQHNGVVHGGERLQDGVPTGGVYVRPAIVEIAAHAPIIQQETFAPILYLIRYRDLDEAVRIHNDVPQGLASAILTRDVREAERFCSPSGSDCGIVNVNIGTSGAEIGGAFGGEKQTGGGRESGSDSWKAYMRRVTSTVNYSDELPLAQGIRFDV